MLMKTPKKPTAHAPELAASPTRITILPLNQQEARVKIIGTAPFIANAFSSKNRQAMISKQELGSQANKGKKRDPKNFDDIYKSSMHYDWKEGWVGHSAAAFRCALIDACRGAQFKMTLAKMSIFVDHDGLDSVEGTPIVRIYGTPVRRDMFVRLATGVADIAPRAVFPEWHAILKLRWDADQFSASDVINLLARAGASVGVGAGRPFSKDSCGIGCGTFRVEEN